MKNVTQMDFTQVSLTKNRCQITHATMLAFNYLANHVSNMISDTQALLVCVIYIIPCPSNLHE